MLGGTVLVALIRFSVSLVGVILLFSLMSEPKYGQKKTVLLYGAFCVVSLLLSCIWYILDWERCVRLVPFVLYFCFAFFAVAMSRDRIFLAVYKLAFTFYLMAFFLIGGIEVSVLFFERSVWADIIVRIILIAGIAVFIDRKMKESLRGFSSYVESELDRFSAVVMVISILFGIGFILNPNIEVRTPYRLFQIVVNFFLTAALQLLVYRLYLHIGKEKEYWRDNQFMQINHRLLQRNVELLEEAAQEGRRIRHDVRHHNIVIAEYARKGQNEELLQYLNDYNKALNGEIQDYVCSNTMVNNLLSEYTRKAKEKGIEVELEVELEKKLPIPGIDLVAILANAYENAIYGCTESGAARDGRKCFIHLMIRRKAGKLVICCKNTCSPEPEYGQSKQVFTGGIGVSSIIETADKFGGEYDFKNDNGVFVFRLVMNVPLKGEDVEEAPAAD